MITLKKGSPAFAVSISGQSGVAYVSVRAIVIQSLGKQQGTAIEAQDGRNLMRQLYVRDGDIRYGFGLVFATREEVDRHIALEAMIEAERSRQGSLRCDESNFSNLRPQYREAAAARIAALKGMTPSVLIKWELNTLHA